MIVFLTSSPSGPLDGSRKVDGLDSKNKFIEKLQTYWKENSKVLMISAFCDNIKANDEMTSFFSWAFHHCGLSCTFDLWDSRVKEYDLKCYDVIVLGGGHVPTENKYFQKIHLKEKLKEYDGIVIGISAGTMNCANIVYAQPEEIGEAINPNYKRFIPGLNLTDTNVLPHYQMVKDYWLDGKRLFEDITYKDSWNHQFIALVDGSYILIENNKEWIYGESYCIQDGNIHQICLENEVVLYKENGVCV